MFRLIIVDDEKIVREGLRDSIDWTELEIDVAGVAEDGQQALELFKEEPVDIVLTDIRMPKMDGLELIKSIKEINKDTSVILLSAYDDFKYAQEAIRLGAYDYILKPIEIESLLQTLTKLIQEKTQMISKRTEHLPKLNVNDMDFFKAEQFKYPMQLEDSLAKAIKRGDTQVAFEIFQQIWDEFLKRDYSFDIKKRWGFELIALLTRTVIEVGENADFLFKNSDPWRIISEFKTQEELFSWFQNMIEAVCEYLNLNKNSKNRKLVDTAIKLIEEYYSDKNLSLNWVSHQIYVTSNYLSTLFKSEIGVGFSDYLSQFRAEKAKELLKDVRLKIYEISEAVGYSDPHYFSKTFKNIVGMTPKEYREKIK